MKQVKNKLDKFIKKDVKALDFKKTIDYEKINKQVMRYWRKHPKLSPFAINQYFKDIVWCKFRGTKYKPMPPVEPQS